MSLEVKSKITGGATEKIMEATILHKYNVSYYQCKKTGFIQTEEPYWLNESYSSVITKLDVGLVNRNIELSYKTAKIICNFFNEDASFIDFAGGYGLFTRLMRDQGFDFYHTDKYCPNIFAEFFDLKSLSGIPDFELLTAFEVFEHMANPVTEISDLFAFSDHILFSTELLPVNSGDNLADWWYFSFETGQHISFHTMKSLEYISQKIGCNFYSNGSSLHLFTKNKFKSNPFAKLNPSFLEKTIGRTILKQGNRRSLIQDDWKYIKDLLAKR